MKTKKITLKQLKAELIRTKFFSTEELGLISDCNTLQDLIEVLCEFGFTREDALSYLLSLVIQENVITIY